MDCIESHEPLRCNKRRKMNSHKLKSNVNEK